MLMHILNVGVGMTFSGGAIDLTLFGILQGNAKTHWIWIVVVGLVYAVVYYFVFYFMITKLNLKTPGREPDDVEPKLYRRSDVNAAKAEKKAPVKKAASKKAELKTEMFLQFAGKEYTDKEIFDKIKYVWSKVLKNKVGDMKDVKIYLKPEESAAYYVINGDTTGKVDL